MGRISAGGIRWSTPALIGILLLATILRFYRLDGQSLWYDEGVSVVQALRDPRAIAVHAAGDIHPPLYYYLLHFWVQGFGTSESALRALSALFGILIVWATYLLGRDLFSKRVGVIAAFLASLSPFQIYYSQETRMYTLVTLLTAGSMLALARFLQTTVELKGKSEGTARSGPRPWLFLVAHVTLTLLALYSHYFAFVVPLTSNLIVMAWFFIRTRKADYGRLLVYWAVSQIIILLLYLPWVALVWERVISYSRDDVSPSLVFMFRDILGVFSLGLSVERGWTFWILPFLFALMLGLLPRRGGQNFSLLFLTLFLFVPPLATYLVSISRPRFLLLATPAYYLVIARGLTGESLPREINRYWRVAGTILLLPLIILPSAFSLYNYYFDPRFARDDYRGLAHYISNLGLPGDAILLYPPGQSEVYSYYYDGPLPIYKIPDDRPPLDPTEAEDMLPEVAAQYRRIFLVTWAPQWSDPQGFLAEWFGARTFKTQDRWYGTLCLSIYSLPEKVFADEPEVPRQAPFGKDIVFQGYSLSRREVRQKETLQLTTFWSASRNLDQRYTIHTSLIDANGDTISQRVADLANEKEVSPFWEAGETIIDRQGIIIEPETPPGKYWLKIAMSDGLHNLPVLNEDGSTKTSLLLGPLQIQEHHISPGDELSIQHPTKVHIAPGTDFLGYGISALEFGPGDTIHLNLYFRSSTSRQAYISLVNGEGQTLEEETIELSAGEEVQRHHFQFHIFLYTPPGIYHFRWGVDCRSPKGECVPSEIPFGRIAIRGTYPLPEVGKISHPKWVRFGQGITLLGFDLRTARGAESAVEAGGIIYLDLYWQATSKIDSRHTVFTHLIGEEPNPLTGGPIWGQHDSEPLNGGYPTSQWIVGQIIIDRHEIRVESTTPPGVYQVEVGMYTLASGERLQAYSKEGQAIGDRILLSTIEVE